MNQRTVAASLALLAAFARGQVVDAFVPDASPAAGTAANSIPFNPSFGALPGSFTQMLVVPAAFLTAAGAVPGAQLFDVALAPAGTGTLTFPQFELRVGHVPTPYPAPQMLGAMTDAATLYDTDASGPFFWSVVGNQWNSFGAGGGGFVWNGVDAVGVYTTHAGLILNSAGWPGTFWRGGAQTRLYAPGYEAATASVMSASALKVRLSFAVGPDAFAYAATYGQGTAGAAGAPFVFTVGEPQFGNASFGVILSNAYPGSTAVLAWSAAPAAFPIGAAGAAVRLNVDLSGLVPFGFFESPVDSSGLAGLNLPIAAYDPNMAGAHFYAQWFVVGDPQGQPTIFGVPVAATAGLDLRIGL
jgi:hypothetical protein